METKIFHGDPKMVQTEMNDFLKQGGINLIDVQMSTCSIGQAVSRSLTTVLILFGRRK